MNELLVSIISWFWCTLSLSSPGPPYKNFTPLFCLKLSVVALVGATHSLTWNLDSCMLQENLSAIQVPLVSPVPCYFAVIFKPVNVRTVRIIMGWFAMKENGYSTFVPSVGLRHAQSPDTPSFPGISASQLRVPLEPSTSTSAWLSSGIVISRAERLLLFIFSFSLSFCGDHEFNKASLREKQSVSQFCFVVLVFEGN